MASSEIAPFASTGGLGEVMRSLPRALRRAGVDVVRIMPLHRCVWEGEHDLSDTGTRLRVPVGYRVHTAEIWRHDGEVTTLFVRRDEYFDRREIYALPEREYTDNFERFVFFQKAVAALLDLAEYASDIVHGHDWTCGLIPLYLRHGIFGLGRSGRERTVFTVHNLRYQGIYPGSEFGLTNLPFSCFSIEGVEFFGNINCLKAGLTSSDVSTTVSPSYADEIRTPEHGFGLDGVLRSLGNRFLGILNGVDNEIWNPGTDPHIAQTFTAENLAGKQVCRSALLSEVGLPLEPTMPVVGMVSRMVDEKGFDLLESAMADIVQLPLKLVVLGKGTAAHQQAAIGWARQWPDRVAVRVGYDEGLAHRIQAGADLFLMPSRNEPCGLSQLYALRYGTIPVVHSVGGLKDTIRGLSADGAEGNGIVFTEYSAGALLSALRHAIALWRQERSWHTLMQRVMREDHGWSEPARRYLGLYEQILRPRG
ncbi:MAG: glycogen synthase GlgA [Kiritimatiellae bacterium]|nr:glycogen synthase GlgA [Kiritimatiellia bacterium]